MNLILYQEYAGCALGHKPQWYHKGIRHCDGTDRFQDIAEFYGHTVEFTTNVDCADIAVFDLDRNQYYTNLNPILLLDDENLTKLQHSNIPVIFWHSGECHITLSKSWFQTSQRVLGRKIWYVDSNAEIQGHQHLFFDSSQLILRDRSRKNFQPSTFDYYFCFFTDRSDIHKHIIYNHMIRYHGSKTYAHYLNPTQLDHRYNDKLNGFDKTTPRRHNRISEEQVIDTINHSMIVVSLNSYFLQDFGSTSPVLYITEKFLQDLATNHPVLPVGHAKSVEYCKSLGFEFPNWIDYRYDVENDDSVRMNMILCEIDRLSKIPNIENLSREFINATHNSRVAEELNFSSNFGNILNMVLGVGVEPTRRAYLA